MRRIAAFIIFPALLLSCGNKNRGKVLGTEKMQQVMWDVLLADAYTQRELKKDSSKKELVQNASLQEKIFELNKVSREDFYTSYAYYNDHPDLMRTILDSIGVKADRDRNALLTERYSNNGGLKKPVPVNKDSARQLRVHEGQ